MIVTKLDGGLGNQLFQWAVTKNLSLKYNTDAFFDTSNYKINNHRKLELPRLNINIKEFDNSVKITKPLKPVRDDFFYKEIKNDSYLIGYWQSEKYFISIENIIREELKINEKTKEYLINKYPFIDKENTVSMHIRRGDYVFQQQHHPLQPIEYYKNAYDKINDNSIIVVVFSDDIEWCKKNIKFKNIIYIENEDNIVSMYLMSMCKNNIIANSTFSWWGAWLNNNPNKIVIAPKLWFGPAYFYLHDGDIIPDRWIRL